MKSTPYLPILDISDLTIFNQLITYDKKRDLKSLSHNPLIEELDDKTRHRVIYSMLTPQKESLKIYDEVINGFAPQKVIDYLILLYKKITEIHNPEKINLVAVLRSGLPLTLLLSYIIYKVHNVKIQVSSISPNYINQIDISLFKNYIKNLNKDIKFIFVDGWCSEGVTYNIVKEFWNNLFPDKKFWYAVLSNLSLLEEKSLIYATRKDVLIPWSICQTDNLGLSNYFLHPIDGTSCAFIIPKDNLKIRNSEHVYRKLIDHKIKYKILFNEPCQEEIKHKYLINDRYDVGVVKLGINECIKSIDKKDDIKLYIKNTPENSYNEILKKYAKANSIKYQNTSKKQSFIIRNFNQKIN